jgi:hypothetical protein
VTDDVNANVDQKPEIDRGFMIREKFYPFPTSYKITDPVLVGEVAGLSWDPFIAAVTGDEEWLEANDAPEETLVMVGLLGCAVWHKHPDWPRAAVVRFVQGIGEEEIDVIGVDVPDEAAPAEVGPGEEEPATT